ncbi:tetratricopeptide repeat protein [Komarekiella sp. 'clone 1']|uniref:Tetratricopeptide repeat protein n=1 Tax=Komarekiella delphini-convector SJRDD-AB1 TaxID=2593771 RepID=A0AA40VRC6_9NOST|nr:tetratricopeptide repeat protein [Komarekiella delphini-convector]MBD6616111.1 tetratricopeptide repeat protein [Komarekiella delphini-convector SJRDD-AB1]
MKFTFSIPSLLAYISSIMLLGLSLPLVVKIPASNASNNCQTFKPPDLNILTDFIGMGHFQEDCQKDSLAAVSSFTQAIRLNSKAEEPYYHRANAYKKLGNYKAAVADYTEVIRQNTGRLGFSSPAYWNRALTYEKLGDKQKAISDFTQVISESASSAEAYFFRANMYRDLGNKESAIADYKVAEKIFQQYVDGVYGNGPMDTINEEMLDKVRNELSSMGVDISVPQITTGTILKSIAKVEVERALNLARFEPQHPTIQHFDAQIDDLYKQLENTQPQVDKIVLKSLKANAAYQKIEGFEIERSQLLKEFSPDHPAIVLIDSQKKELEALISHNKI